MAKSDLKAHQWRMDGMIYALEIAEKYGIEALRKEVSMRNGRFIPLELSRSYLQEVHMELASRITSTYSTMALATLRDGFGFGKTRLHRWIAQFNDKCETVDVLDLNGEHYARISDYAQMLADECDIHVDLDAIYRAEAGYDKSRRTQ